MRGEEGDGLTLLTGEEGLFLGVLSLHFGYFSSLWGKDNVLHKHQDWKFFLFISPTEFLVSNEHIFTKKQ